MSTKCDLYKVVLHVCFLAPTKILVFEILIRDCEF